MLTIELNKHFLAKIIIKNWKQYRDCIHAVVGSCLSFFKVWPSM